MSISSKIFEAYLHCPTKCLMMSHGEIREDNVYAVWMREKNQFYAITGIKRLTGGLQAGEFICAPPTILNVKTASWRLASEITASSKKLESCIHAIERVPSAGRGKPAQFLPIRFIANNKLTKFDKLLIAFDAHVLAEAFNRVITSGKIIHGDDLSTVKVNTSVLAGEVRKLVGKISQLLAGDVPPDLVLNRHCPECFYQNLCHEKAIEKDDLSLLGGMGKKERKKLNSKGIFTVTQLSYTFRPRRRPKRQRDKKEKYHQSLKALAIREKKIHIVGSPELKIEGTPIYLDVEGLPDRDFYYLIGLRIRQGDEVIHHSLWADRPEDEERIWREFFEILVTIEKPVLIHYGSYETTFIKTMCSRYGASFEPTLSSKLTSEVLETPEVYNQNSNHQTSEVLKTSDVLSGTNVSSISTKTTDTSAEKSFPATAINLLSVIYGHVYFPVASNGLKAVAKYCGFKWSEALASGLQSIVWRERWEVSRDVSSQESLTRYNVEDCEALEVVATITQQFGERSRSETDNSGVVYAYSEKLFNNGRWRNFTSSVSSLEFINSAAHWNYQRDRVYARLDIKKPTTKNKAKQLNLKHLSATIIVKSKLICPTCGQSNFSIGHKRHRLLYDIVFGSRSQKLRLIKYVFQTYNCIDCSTNFGMPDRFQHGHIKYGWNLISYFFYQVVELCIPQRTVVQAFNRLFGFDLSRSTLYNLKIRTADYYGTTKQQILERIICGNHIHVDETRANIKGKSAYVWILANHTDVIYFLSESREGEFAHKLLENFKGVLVSDFYTAYDSIDCPQQKCLIHLIRDLNDEVLNFPFDEQLKQIVVDFGGLLQPIVETIDHHGLKTYFMRKHIFYVNQFFLKLESTRFTSEAALKCKDRFKRNKETLFTFLRYDGVSWNNNDAEHAVKAFAKLRDVIEGSSTTKGTDEYLTLLSVCQTCKYRGLDFLDFLRSGEKNIDVFAASQKKRRKNSTTKQTSEVLKTSEVYNQNGSGLTSEVSKNLGGLVIPAT